MIPRYWIVVLLLAGLFRPAVAQPFNIRIDPFGQGYGDGALSVEVSNNGNYLVVASVPFNNGQFYYSSVVTSIMLSPLGEVLQIDRVVDPLHATYPGFCNSIVKRTDGGFVVGGGNFTTDSMDNWIQRPVLYFFDATGAYEEQVPLGPDNQSWIGRQANQTPDGGYVISGEHSATEGNGLDAFVIKTDAQGNEEWTRSFGGQWNDTGNSIASRMDGGYFFGGQYRINSSDAQVWVMALNYMGGVAWSRTWGGNFQDLNPHVVEMADGHVLISSGLGHSSNGLYQAYMAKLDRSDGAFIWEREYGPVGPEVIIRSVHEITPFGDLIAVGRTRVSNSYYGTLFRTTNDGDSLWLRNYQYHDSLVSNASGLFYDAVPTPDGGFVAVGSAFSINGIYTQDVWVIKTDSMGCIEPGCDVITGMQTQLTNMKDALRVWPNPVQAGGAVQVELQLPDGFKADGPLQLTVTNGLGQLVHRQGLAQNPRPEVLEGQLSSGLYHLHLHDNTRWIAGAKLVVE